MLQGGLIMRSKILLSLFSLFIIICFSISVSHAGEKQFRVGMTWLVKDVANFGNNMPPMVTYDRYEVTRVSGGKVTWIKTTLNKKKKPFAGTEGFEFTFPILKVKDLAPGKDVRVKVAGRTFRCRKIVSAGGTVWRSLDYPLIAVKEDFGNQKRVIVEFNE
jgi:hypothetical protein